MGNTDLEKIMGDGEGGQGTPTATPAGEPSGDDDVTKRINAAVTKVTEGFKNRIDSLQTKIGTLETENQSLKRVTKPLEAMQSGEPPKPTEPKFDTGSFDGWDTHIKSQAKNAADEAVEKVKTSVWNKALSRFTSSRKEYDPKTEEGKVKLSRVTELAKRIGTDDEYDQDSIFNALEAAWTVENRQSLQEQAALAERLKAQTDLNLVDLASSGASDPVRTGGGTEATPTDMRAYREYQKAGGELDVKTFLELSQRI